MSYMPNRMTLIFSATIRLAGVEGGPEKGDSMARDAGLGEGATEGSSLSLSARDPPCACGVSGIGDAVPYTLPASLGPGVSVSPS
jgi:hypothetical protein